MKTLKLLQLSAFKLTYPALVWALMAVCAYDYYFLAHNPDSLAKIEWGKTSSSIESLAIANLP